MRPTVRWLQQLERSAPRIKSTSFIGLGRMGSEMAYNLFSKQYIQSQDSHFVVCDALPESAKAFRDNFLAQFPGANLEVVDTPVQAALASKTIITMLPSSPQVKQVYSGSIIPTVKGLSSDDITQTLCIDSTTLDVDVAREIANELNSIGARVVDAPVSGGKSFRVAGAKAGTLSFLVGGTEQSFKLSQPILAHMGQRIIHCGPSGAGLGAKICNNVRYRVQQIVVAEGMLLGQKLGLDPTVLASVINSSTGGCWASSVNNPVPGALPGKSPPCERDYQGGFVTALMLKDMGLATEIATKNNTPLPLGELAEALYAKSIKEQPELATRDFSSIYKYLKSRTQGSSR
ncbi:3-hydroxyisobutyrate dehydrogenase, mitochondrial [Leucoagaricus sp. SymC.cos]|nr:3-hydroxyisobutyrate dehydrogenase, mitochondrial [Leucoagaricus sp. SymC.cos]